MRVPSPVVILLGAFLLLGAACGDDTADRPPNVVLVITDDQGYGDLGCQGAEGFATPHLDGLAREGLVFRSFCVSQAVCSASRASLLTGCYAERVGIGGALGPWDTKGLHPDEETIADLLKARGYATCAVGKWHLGHLEPFLPRQQGFDEYLGVPYSNDMWPVDYDGKRHANGFKANYPELPLIEGDEVVARIRNLADQDTLTEKYTDRAVRFIEENHARPFFLYVAHTMPHVPLGVGKGFRGSSEQGTYGDVIQEIDASVGRILAALARHDLVEDTLVIFLSDNGPWRCFGDHAGSAGPLREGKLTIWEGGVRVPCLMRRPGHIAAGRSTDELAASSDILPTIVAATGADLPTRRIDGVDLTPLLEDASAARPRDAFLYYDAGTLRAVREGRYKLVFPHRSVSYEGVEPGRGGLRGPYGWLDVPRSLYDLVTDPSETTDVLGAHPEVVERLEARADAARADLGDRDLAIEGTGRRPPGRIGADRPREVEHLARGSALSLETAYAAKYAAGGDGELVDGRLGSLDHLDGRWQGYEATDLRATVDLGQVRKVTSITCRFLEGQMSWIFLPTEVEVAVSADGIAFEGVQHWTVPVPTRRPTPSVQSIEVSLLPRRVRYVRLRARCLEACPSWHPGAGGKPWVFSDEIIVR